MSTPLRVTAPLLTWVPGGMGGSETFVRALVAEFDRRPDVDLTVVVNRAAEGLLGARHELVDRRIAGRDGTSSRVVSLVRGVLRRGVAAGPLGAADVVVYPYTVPIPRQRTRPWVQVLYDVQHLDLPELFSVAERRYRAITYDRSARRATRIVTTSEFSRGRIVERLGVEPDRVDVAHLGVDLTWFTPGRAERQPFVLYPAAAWAHKNHRRLIEAMVQVRQTRPDLRLVLTGAGRERLGDLPTWVEHRGRVSEHELRDLYRSASCLAFPSLYEGFGLPPLEAMAAGCPVAVADAGSLPETCGDAVVYFDPEDPAEITAAILRAIEDRDRLVALGQERAATFTWKRCADAHVASMRRAIGGTSPTVRR